MSKQDPLAKTQIIPDSNIQDISVDCTNENKSIEGVQDSVRKPRFTSLPENLNQVTRHAFLGAMLALVLIGGSLYMAYSESLGLLEEQAELVQNATQFSRLKVSELRDEINRQKEMHAKNSIRAKDREAEIVSQKKRVEVLQSQVVTTERLDDLSAANKDTIVVLQKMLTNSASTLERTEKQLQAISAANVTLQDELVRLRFLQDETSKINASSKPRNTSSEDLQWTPWISSEDVTSFMRESIANKARIPLVVEGKASGAGLSYRFFIIPNAYQLRWTALWNQTDQALVREINYHGGKKYFELTRQSFFVNSNSPRFQVVFVHQLDMDEARRLKEKYFAKK